MKEYFVKISNILLAYLHFLIFIAVIQQQQQHQQHQRQRRQQLKRQQRQEQQQQQATTFTPSQTVFKAHQFHVYVGRNVSLPCFANTKKELSLEFYWLKWKGNDTQAISSAVSKKNFHEIIEEKTKQQTSRTEKLSDKVRSKASTVQSSTTTSRPSAASLFKMILAGPRFKRISRNPLVINNDTLRYSVDMVIRNATKSDEGFYTCFVTDNVDSVHKTIFLKVDDICK